MIQTSAKRIAVWAGNLMNQAMIWWVVIGLIFTGPLKLTTFFSPLPDSLPHRPGTLRLFAAKV
jgi:hypothetical protein